MKVTDNIPLVYGLAAAQERIGRSRGLTDKSVSPALARRIEQLVGEQLSPDALVTRILDDVRARGDAAVSEWSALLDGVDAQSEFRVGSAELQEAYLETPEPVRAALHLAAERIRTFHDRQLARLTAPSPALEGIPPLPNAWLMPTEAGGALGQLVQPLRRVGIYVPGGSAPLPSSLLMAAVPAAVAGVREIVVASPPTRAGRIAPVILAAAHVAQVTEVGRIPGR